MTVSDEIRKAKELIDGSDAVIRDLIPLCSNCHTAIHKMVDGHFSTVEELRRHVDSKKYQPTNSI